MSTRPTALPASDESSSARSPTPVISLAGKRGLILGIGNERSVAYGCARQFHAAGAELAITYVNPKTERHVRPISEKLDSRIILPCDVSVPGALESVFLRIAQNWGRLDFLLHAIGYARPAD